MDYVNGVPALALDDAVSDVPLYTDELRNVLVGTGWTDIGVFSSLEADWSVNQAFARRVGHLIGFVAQLTYTGASISVPANGNVGNNIVGQLSEQWRSDAPLPVPVLSTNADPGALCVFTAWSSGTLRLDRVANAGDTSAITSGATMNVAGTWLRG